MASDAIVLHSGGNLVLANEAAARLFGVAGPEQLLGKPIGDFVAAKKRSAVQQDAQKLSSPGGSTLFVKRKLIRLNATRFDAEVAATPCSYDGKPAAKHGVRHVSERKEIDQPLR